MIGGIFLSTSFATWSNGSERLVARSPVPGFVIMAGPLACLTWLSYNSYSPAVSHVPKAVSTSANWSARPPLTIRASSLLERDPGRVGVPHGLAEWLVAEFSLENATDRATRQLGAELDVARQSEVRELIDAPTKQRFLGEVRT